MKSRKILTMLILCLLVCSAQVSQAAPMGTAFTYQGRLIDSNDAADGDSIFFQLTAADTSGNKNKGKIEGAAAAQGKFGRALRFTGRASASASGFLVRHNWTQDAPIFARAIVLAGGTLFVAGPPDLLDEQQALSRIDDPNVRRNLEEQSASFKGEKGAILMAVSAADGRTLAQYDLDNAPVFDGLIAAGSRLYMTTTNGQVLCMTGK